MPDKNRDDIVVVIGHPYADIATPLSEWIKYGPGPRRFVAPFAARTVDGQRLPLSVIPLRYRNNCLSRLLIRLHLIPNPWAK